MYRLVLHGLCSRGGGKLDAPLWALTGWWGQLNKAIGLHAQHRHPTRHLFKSPIGLIPVERLAVEPGKFGPSAAGLFGNEAADLYEVIGTELATTVAMTHERL